MKCFVQGAMWLGILAVALSGCASKTSQRADAATFSPEPSQSAPTPEHSPSAPTPEPSQSAPTPEPSQSAPTPEPLLEPALTATLEASASTAAPSPSNQAELKIVYLDESAYTEGTIQHEVIVLMNKIATALNEQHYDKLPALSEGEAVQLQFDYYEKNNLKMYDLSLVSVFIRPSGTQAIVEVTQSMPEKEPVNGRVSYIFHKIKDEWVLGDID